ncbi:MAG: NusG domain II-containing protein [Clostridia bacterium]|nr:NusG domain II-containing protein [Clostridia bacterium]
MKKGDIALLIIAVIVLAIWLFPSQKGEVVSIYVDGKIYETLPLEKDSETLVQSEYGKNKVVIRGKKVYVTDADCPDRLCEKTKITKSGRSIICLPNRLSVVIEGGKSNEKIDVII